MSGLGCAATLALSRYAARRILETGAADAHATEQTSIMPNYPMSPKATGPEIGPVMVFSSVIASQYFNGFARES